MTRLQNCDAALRRTIGLPSEPSKPGSPHPPESPELELEQSAIHPSFIGRAVEIAKEIEYHPTTREPIATPLDDALGKRYTRFGRQAKANEQGLIFRNEDSSVWQVKRELGVLQADGRRGKYLAPKGIGNRAYLPPIPDAVLKLICDRHSLNFKSVSSEITDHGSFWAWVETHPELPLVITEGAKKALAALSQGYIAIALYGCKCGRSEDLVPFLTPGRLISVAFDADTKGSAKKAVKQGIGILRGAIGSRGAVLSVAQWQPRQGKGLDDLIAKSGPAAMEKAIAGATLYALYKARNAVKNPLGKYQPNLRVNVPCLGAAIAPESIQNEGIVILHSGLGTGKTKLIEKLIADCEAVIAPGHRASLQTALATSLGLEYIGEVDLGGGYIISRAGLPTKRVSLCWDSLLKVPALLFPDGSYILVLDEVDQGFWHLLKGATVAKGGKRPGIVARGIDRIHGARLVIAASGTLSAQDIKLLVALRQEQPWILQNDYQGNAYPITLYTHDSAPGAQKQARGAAIAEIETRIRRGEFGIIACDQRISAKALRLMAESLGVPPEAILTITRETSGNKLQQSFLDAKDKAKWLREHGIVLVIHNSSLTSGINIEEEYFDFVGGLFEGKTIAPNDAIQQLARCRPAVPRIVFAAARGVKDQNGATNARDYQRNLDRQESRYTQATGRSFALQHEAITAYIATAAAARNRAMADFGAYLQAGLEAAGHTVTLGTPTGAADAAAQRWQGWLQAVRDRYFPEVVDSLIINGDRAKALQEKLSLTHAESLQLERFKICDFFHIHPETLTPEAVKADGKGRYRRNVSRLENLLWEGLAQAKDDAQLALLTRWNQPIAPHDRPCDEFEAKAAIALEVPALLEKCLEATATGAGWYRDTPWVKAVGDRARACSEDVRLCLGFNPAKMTGVQIVGEILRRYGLKTCSKRITLKGERARRYEVHLDSFDTLQDLLLKRAPDHFQQGLTPAATPLMKYLLPGVAWGRKEEEQVPVQTSSPCENWRITSLSSTLQPVIA
ncbi:MAG: plasmid replication protein, CyRepA1 family [Spirulinaceae cyanobacterium]